MSRRLVALLLALLVALSAGAGSAEAAVHHCGEQVVLSCACDHGGPHVSDGQDDACCSDHALPGSAPAQIPSADAPVAALEAADPVFVPPLGPPVRLPEPLEARPAAPARGPPHVPLFLEHRALLN